VGKTTDLDKVRRWYSSAQLHQSHLSQIHSRSTTEFGAVDHKVLFMPVLGNGDFKTLICVVYRNFYVVAYYATSVVPKLVHGTLRLF